MAKKLLCINCGYQGKPKFITKGSILIEIILWICFIIPGVIYSLWRHASRYRACPSCEAGNMIPLNSPRAQELLKSSKPSPEPVPEKPTPEPEAEMELPERDEKGRCIIPES